MTNGEDEELIYRASDRGHLRRLNLSNCHVNNLRVALQINNSDSILLGVSLKHTVYELLK